MKRLVCIAGTRPEVIKLAPVHHALRERAGVEVEFWVSGQHRELLDDALDCVGITPEEDLELMRPGQSLPELASALMSGISGLLARRRPDVVVVQGDTSTCFVSALAAYYAHVDVAHVEAGLRTGDPLAPFPEEQHRALTDRLARWLFAPTTTARECLEREGLAPEKIHVTGNTGIDTLRATRDRMANDPRIDAFAHEHGLSAARLIVATLHRREAHGSGIGRVCRALADLAARDDVDVVLPTHPHPAVASQIREALGHSPVHLVAPLSYPVFVGLLDRAALVLTDSGGLQEESAALGVPTLVARAISDRPEAVAAGVARLVGHDPERIVAEAARILDDAEHRAHMARPTDVFGDGGAGARIADVLVNAD